MDGRLYINGKDSFQEYGIRMGDSFVSSLMCLPRFKEVISTTSRMEHGTRVIIQDRLFAQRDVTLNFTITGTDIADRMEKEKRFKSLLMGNELIDFYIPDVSDEHFRMYCKGGSSYNLALDGTIVGCAYKFCEPNPGDRD